MQSNRNTTTEASGKTKKSSSFSPRELIMYHMENPDEPITDEDLRNLNLKKQRVIDFVADEFSRGE